MQETTHINPASTVLGDKFTQLEPDSITVEEGDLLYALVRMRKPKLAIETGTGHQMATRRIVDALMANGEGHLISCDTDEDYVLEAQLEIPSSFVEIRRTTGLELLAKIDQAEFILVDAGNVLNRLAEVKAIVEGEKLVSQGTLVIHDAIHDSYKQIVAYLKDQGWPGMIFDSLAGIAVFQRP